MSGHSKWSTIKRQKEATDKKRGILFSKLSRAITIAVRQGGTYSSVNLKLRFAIEKAKQANMPKDNIERAIERGKGAGGEALEEILYEGYGPFGMAVLVEAATDNRNRTSQEVKNLFERGGGSLGGPGSVSFQFEKKGLLLADKAMPALSVRQAGGRQGANAQEAMLELIDLGAPDLEETDDGIEVYVPPQEISSWKEKIEAAGFKVKQAEFFYKPNVYVDIHDKEKVQKALKFLDSLDEHDDVQRVFANLDVPGEILSGVGNN